MGPYAGHKNARDQLIKTGLFFCLSRYYYLFYFFLKGHAIEAEFLKWNATTKPSVWVHVTCTQLVQTKILDSFSIRLLFIKSKSSQSRLNCSFFSYLDWANCLLWNNERELPTLKNVWDWKVVGKCFKLKINQRAVHTRYSHCSCALMCDRYQKCKSVSTQQLFVVCVHA